MGGQVDHSSAELARTLAATGEQSATTTSSGPPSSPSSPEQIGRFLILGELGRGGMGVVYAAYDPQLDRKVAIKLILGERAGPGGQERLRREAQAMARLSHQHVVHIHDVGNAEGGVYLAMEYVHGRTLRAWLEESPREVQAILEVFLQAAAGLSAAHAAGVIHRDFKPDNILIDERGQVKIADFGLARQLGGGAGHADPRAAIGLTVDGSVLGTPAYMAPEQHLGASSDARSDQYSFS